MSKTDGVVTVLVVVSLCVMLATCGISENERLMKLYETKYKCAENQE